MKRQIVIKIDIGWFADMLEFVATLSELFVNCAGRAKKYFQEWGLNPKFFLPYLYAIAIPMLVFGIVWTLTQNFKLAMLFGVSVGLMRSFWEALFMTLFSAALLSCPPPLNCPTGPNIGTWAARVYFVDAIKCTTAACIFTTIGWAIMLCWSIWSLTVGLFLAVGIVFLSVGIVFDFIFFLVHPFYVCHRVWPEATWFVACG